MINCSPCALFPAGEQREDSATFQLPVLQPSLKIYPGASVHGGRRAGVVELLTSTYVIGTAPAPNSELLASLSLLIPIRHVPVQI